MILGHSTQDHKVHDGSSSLKYRPAALSLEPLSIWLLDSLSPLGKISLYCVYVQCIMSFRPRTRLSQLPKTLGSSYIIQVDLPCSFGCMPSKNIASIPLTHYQWVLTFGVEEEDGTLEDSASSISSEAFAELYSSLEGVIWGMLLPDIYGGAIYPYLPPRSLHRLPLRSAITQIRTLLREMYMQSTPRMMMMRMRRTSLGWAWGHRGKGRRWG